MSNSDKSHLQSYAANVLERARDLKQSDAFTPPSQARALMSVERVKERMKGNKKRNRRMMLILVAICIAIVAVSLCIPYYSMGHAVHYFYSPAVVVDYWATWAQTAFGPIFDPTLANRADLMWSLFAERNPQVNTTFIFNRGVVTFFVIVCGCLLGASGLLFQTAFRNPLATPSILGVSDGVTLGVMLFAMMGHQAVGEDSTLYALLVFGCGAVMLVVVFALARVISGGARYNVFDLLLVGTVITQLLSGVNNYITTFFMNIETWNRFYEMQQAFDLMLMPIIQRTCLIIAAVTIVVSLVLCFRFNMLSFDDGEARMSGVRPRALRTLALVVGALMQLAALATIGQVAMLSLIVPFLVRYLLPSDFRYQVAGNFLLGSAVLLAGMALQPFIRITSYTMPVGTVIGLIAVPVFVWIVALQRRGWE